MFVSLQNQFANALFEPAYGVPAGIADAQAATKRFNVYRNNVTVGLLEALAARFPVTRQIVGDDFFNALARLYIKAHPPNSPLMMFYGDTFAAFLAPLDAISELPYLADIVRLEAARTRAYHAEDRKPLDLSALRTIDAADIGNLRFELHPSVEIIESEHPIATIWAMHEGSSPLDEISDWQAEAVVVARPELDVETHRLTLAGATFLRSLQAGQSLADAVETALTCDSHADVTDQLAMLLSARLAVAFSITHEDNQL